MEKSSKLHKKISNQSVLVMQTLTLFIGLLVSIYTYSEQTENCFCIEDGDDAIWYDCKEITKAEGAKRRIEIYCTTKTGKKSVKIKEDQSMHRLKASEGACNPCQVIDVINPNIPRGGNGLPSNKVEIKGTQDPRKGPIIGIPWLDND